MPLRRSLFAGLVLLGALWAVAAARADQAPARTSVFAPVAMVAAADPRAVDAALEILKAGGSATDAAITAAIVLGLVEPQSSGIGGGGFLLHYSAADGTIESYDGRELAPAAVTPDMFLTPDDKRQKRKDVALGGLAVGVPGLFRMMALAHQSHGRLPWARLFEPAIALAEQGFEISPQLAKSIAETEGLDTFEETRVYFFTPDDKPKPAGARLANPAFAETLKQVAAKGADAFYEGAIADDIVAAVRGASENPGRMTAADLAAYEAVRRPPLCGTYRVHLICGMGPPSSGGATVLQILKLLERFDLAALQPGSAEAAHLFAEASRLAFADRNRYLADSDHVAIPLDGLLDPGYIAARSRLIDPKRAMEKAEPGTPPGSGMLAMLDAGAAREGESTSHLVVADVAGNVVTFTSSIERGFGSYLMVRGFLLNNQLTDFAFKPTEDGRDVANRVEPAKRPRSSMAPTFVFDEEGRLEYALGSPGGPRIIDYVAQTLIGLIDWRLDIQSAINLPHVQNRNAETELEAGTSATTLEAALSALGHKVLVKEQRSGLQGIHFRDDRLEGGADPRREGVAKGY